jgi:hypothetical protein
MDTSKATEAMMNCCGVCGGKFGLVRYYTWRNAGLCSKRCRSRLRTREVGGFKWLFGQAA